MGVTVDKAKEMMELMLQTNLHAMAEMIRGRGENTQEYKVGKLCKPSQFPGEETKHNE